MTLTPDYKESLEQVRERLGLLDSLNYLSLLDEATSTKGKAWLDKYSKTGGFDFSLHFMRDREQLLKSLEQDGIKFGEDLEVKKNPIGMFRWAKDGADKYKADGVWTDEKRKEYKYQLSRLEKALEDRLRQFVAAYDYPLSADEPKQQSEPQQAAPEPQQGEQEARQRQHKQLGRKRKALKELIVPTDKETIYNRLQQQMEGASNDVAMNILINSIRNKILLKPSYGTFREAFPTITIPESTYYDKLKKAGIR